MSGRAIRRFVAGLALSLAAAWAMAESNPCTGKFWVAGPVLALGSDEHSGIGGTGRSGDDYGIGGTGHGGDDHGIGGTGHGGDGAGLGGTGHLAALPGGDGIGGTGIVGVVAGFGSICVDGLEIHYEPATPTRIDGAPAPTADLALGQMVSLRVTQVGERLQAQEIAVLNSLVGPVEQFDAAKGRLQILGQSVSLPALSALPAQTQAALQPGRWLAVAGNRLADGRILPTRIALAPAADQVSILGPVSAVSGRRLRIGGLEVSLAPGLALPVAGEEIWLRGHRQNGVLLADVLQEAPRTHFSQPVRHLLVQAYVRQIDGRNLNLDGTAIGLPGQLDTNGAGPGSRVQVSVAVDDAGRMVAERLSVERPAQSDARSGGNLGNGGNSGNSGNGGNANAAPKSGKDTVSGDNVVPTAANAARPELVRAGQDSARTDISRPEVVRPEVTRVEVARPDIVRPEIVRPEIQRPEVVRPDVQRPEMVRPEMVRPEVIRPDIARPELPGRHR